MTEITIFPGMIEELGPYYPQPRPAGNYYLRCNAVSGHVGNGYYAVEVECECCVPPTITQHPSPPSLTICDGDSHQYCISAEGTPSLTYQWQRNSSNIGGATSSCYTATQAGAYRCVVTNDCGTTTSNSATLIVLTDADCDDGQWCTGNETCVNGQCQSSGDPCLGGPECNNHCNEGPQNCYNPPGADCGDPADTQCDNPDTCNGFGTCQPNHEPNGTECPDTAFCNGTDTCLNGECSQHTGDPCVGGPECNNHCNEHGGGTGDCYNDSSTTCGDPGDTECDNPDTCNGFGTCLPNHEPNGTECDDEEFCNGMDTCLNGECSQHTGDPCLPDECCDEENDQCVPCIGACCQPDGSCLDDVEEGDCQGPCQTFYELELCENVTCPPPCTGACCVGTGCLENLTQTFCEETLYGGWPGPGTTCDDDPPLCDFGACCAPSIGECIEDWRFECEDLDGDFIGDETVCDPNPPCPGACCVDEVCVPDQTGPACDSVGGVYVGAYTACDPNPCVSGACCVPSIHECVETLAFVCDEEGGTFQGPETVCDPNPCPGACCLDGVCVPDQLKENCESTDGLWMGVYIPCDPNPCCIWDMDDNGVVDPFDEFFVTGRFGCENATPPVEGCDRADIDGNGVVDPFDRNAVMGHFGPCP